MAVTRFANLYGGGDLNHSRLIPEAVSAAIDGRRPVIRSDGSPERDYLYVEDAARAYLAIAAALDEGRGRGEAFNAGGGEPHSVRTVLDLVSEVAGVELDPDFQGGGTLAGEIDRQYLDSTKLRETTGWQPQVDLREGLRLTLDWYREHPEAKPLTVVARSRVGAALDRSEAEVVEGGAVEGAGRRVARVDVLAAAVDDRDYRGRRRQALCRSGSPATPSPLPVEPV